MTLKRIKTGQRGRPQIQISPQDLEQIRQLAAGGMTRVEIAKELGVGWSTWLKLCKAHPAIPQIIKDAYASIGYEYTVTSRRATLVSEAEQRGDDPADINIETYSNSELDQLYSLARQGLPSHAIPKHMKPPMPPAIWSKLWNSDARGKAVHAKGIAAAASEVVKNVEEPPKPAPQQDEALERRYAEIWESVTKLAADHARLLFESDDEMEWTEEPVKADDADLERMLS